MRYNLHIVEFKLFEADFFLDKLKNYKISNTNFSEPEYYLSAFLSSSRSVTFTLQYVFSDMPGFKLWYEKAQDTLRKSDLATFFKEARNNNQKKGATHLKVTEVSNKEVKFFYYAGKDHGFAPKNDMISACEEYFKLLLQIVANLFDVFGMELNPLVYYSLENLEKRGETIKSLELEVYGYNKWTNLGLPEDLVLARIRDKMLYTNLPKLLEKYDFNNRNTCPTLVQVS